MAYKNTRVYIDGVETETTIRRIKKKEFKDIAVELAQKGDELIKLGNTDITSVLPIWIGENIDFVCDKMIKPFTSLDAEQLDEMDLIDVIALGRELLEYNCVNVEKVLNFLKPDSVVKQQIAEAVNFSGITIPSQN